jgi:hypothetical protein
MKQRMSFKNLPKIQVKRFHKLRLEKEQEQAKQLAAQQSKKQSSRRTG